MTKPTQDDDSVWSVGRHLRVAAMLIAMAWVVVYRLSEQSAKLPEFVYVNF